jgi:hypothetical protein
MENVNTGTLKFTSRVQAWVALVAVILVADGCFSGVAATVGSCTSSMSSLAAVEGDNPPLPTDECCAIVCTTDTGRLCNFVTEYSSAIGVNVPVALLLPKLRKHIIPAGYTCDGTNSHASSQLHF